MAKVFNLGIGMIVVVPEADVYKALDVLRSHGQRPSVIGSITAGHGARPPRLTSRPVLRLRSRPRSAGTGRPTPGRGIGGRRQRSRANQVSVLARRPVSRWVIVRSRAGDDHDAVPVGGAESTVVASADASARWTSRRRRRAAVGRGRAIGAPADGPSGARPALDAGRSSASPVHRRPSRRPSPRRPGPPGRSQVAHRRRESRWRGRRGRRVGIGRGDVVEVAVERSGRASPQCSTIAVEDERPELRAWSAGANGSIAARARGRG